MLIIGEEPFHLLYLIINLFYAQRFIRVVVLPEVYCQKQQLCEEFRPFNVKRRGGIVAEVDDGGEKLLSVRWFYLYSVDIHTVDIIQQLSDKRGDGRKFSLFECYSLLVLVDKAFGENVFLLMILIIRVVVKKCYV